MQAPERIIVVERLIAQLVKEFPLLFEGPRSGMSWPPSDSELACHATALEFVLYGLFDDSSVPQLASVVVGVFMQQPSLQNVPTVDKYQYSWGVYIDEEFVDREFDEFEIWRAAHFDEDDVDVFLVGLRNDLLKTLDEIGDDDDDDENTTTHAMISGPPPFCVPGGVTIARPRRFPNISHGHTHATLLTGKVPKFSLIN